MITFVIASAVRNHRSVEINDMCGYFEDQPDSFAGLAAFTSANMGDDCMDYDYESSLERLRDTRVGNAARLFNYQLCIEKGVFPSSDGHGHVFGTNFPMELYWNFCVEGFDGL
jgi:hypothetical protein